MQMVLQQGMISLNLSAVGRGMPVVFEERLQRDFEVGAWQVASPHCFASGSGALALDLWVEMCWPFFFWYVCTWMY
jgi:hypothetical protein